MFSTENLRDSLATRKWKQGFHCHSLLGALYISVIICLRTTIQDFFSERLLAQPLKKLKRFVQLPKYLTLNIKHQALASCTTSVYVNLSKNSFSVCRRRSLPRLAGAKVHTFSETTKLLGSFFLFSYNNISCLDACQDTKAIYLIIYN